MATYLHVGTNKISACLFRQVKNGYSAKPYGGLWLTKQSEDTIYNAWVGYLSEHPHLLYFKGYDDLTNIPCALIELKPNTKIYQIANDTELSTFQKKYGQPQKTDWLKLSKEYDGIDLTFSKLGSNPQLSSLMKDYCLDSTIIFNAQCLKNYEPGFITGLHIYNDGCFDDYTMTFTGQKYPLSPAPKSYFLLAQQIKIYVQNYLIAKNLTDLTFEKYLKIFTEIQNCVTEHFQKAIAEVAKESNTNELVLTKTLVDNTLLF